jgi:8-oxo-dGTP diphosphatase
MAEQEIETIVRGIMLAEGQVLCVRRKGADNIFLPGGHIDPGESAEQALVRELREELGIAGNITGFLGTVEHSFTNGDGYTHEMNLVFRFEGEDLYPGKDPLAAEEHLEFLWLPAEGDILEQHNMQPWILREALVGLNTGRGFPAFLSTLQNNIS